MDTNDLLRYLQQVKAIEIEILTHQKITERYKEKAYYLRPRPPQKKERKKPIPPNRPVNLNNTSNNVFPIIISLSFTVLGIMWLYIMIQEKKITFLPVIGFGWGVLCAYSFINYIKEEIQNEKIYESALKAYDEKMILFINEQKIYNEEMVIAEKEYQDALSKHNKDYEKYELASQKMIDTANQVLSVLCNRRDKLYAQNIIYPKYRNIVAITSFCEYFESGRCDCLEGVNGAYNLFEMEIRQNIIISELSMIISNLESIKRNQYALFEALVAIDNKVNKIMSAVSMIEIEAKLTAYYSEIIAITETSPRYSFGIIM